MKWKNIIWQNRKFWDEFIRRTDIQNLKFKKSSSNAIKFLITNIE